MNSKVMKDVVLRSFALFLVTALPAIGAGSFVGIAPIHSAVIAGALAVSRILTDLAKAFLDDGKLTQDEVDAIFKKANKKDETK
jgi:hypothetical protein